MNSFLHPRSREFRFVVANRLHAALRRWPETLFHLVGWSLLASAAGMGLRLINGDVVGIVLQLLVGQPLASGIAVAGFGFLMSRTTTLALATQMQQGWWGAVPVPASATRHTLILNALLYGLLANLIIAAVLSGVVVLSQRPATWFVPLLSIASVGLWLGGFVGFMAARRTHAAPAHTRASSHSSTPLLHLPMLDHHQLHNLPEWQRRDATRRWRSGGRSWQVLALGLLIPMGMQLPPLIGLLLLGVSLIWYGLALRSSEDVIVQASRLVAALPLRFAPFAAATLRYPVFAWLALSLFGVVGLYLQGAKPLVVVLYPVAIAIGSAVSLSLTWRYRHRPWLARVRTTVEICLLLAFARDLALLVPLLAAALVARHYFVARSLT